MKVKNKETLFQSYLKMEKITLEHDDKTFIRERLDKKNAVAGLVYNTNTKKFIFVSQWRPGPLDYIIEIPAGVKDVVGEDPPKTYFPPSYFKASFIIFCTVSSSKCVTVKY